MLLQTINDKTCMEMLKGVKDGINFCNVQYMIYCLHLIHSNVIETVSITTTSLQQRPVQICTTVPVSAETFDCILTLEGHHLGIYVGLNSRYLANFKKEQQIYLYKMHETNTNSCQKQKQYLKSSNGVQFTRWQIIRQSDTHFVYYD